MSPRPSRRHELVQAALAAFIDNGYEATSVGRLAELTGLSKAAFTYHFSSKEALLVEIATPLLDSLHRIGRSHPRVPEWPDEVRSLLTDYIDALIANADVVTWIDGDKAVLNHPALGARLRRSNVRMRKAIAGRDASERALVQAAAVLGMLWRPMRNLDARNVVRARDAVLDLAVGAVGTVRGVPSTR